MQYTYKRERDREFSCFVHTNIGRGVISPNGAFPWMRCVIMGAKETDVYFRLCFAHDDAMQIASMGQYNKD